jgi:hypothetical protein
MQPFKGVVPTCRSGSGSDKNHNVGRRAGRDQIEDRKLRSTRYQQGADSYTEPEGYVSASSVPRNQQSQANH